MKHLVQRLTLTAALLVLTGAIPRHLAAGESLPCLHEIEITCVPDRLIIGSTPFTTWRINGVDQFGHQVDQVFTWDHVDRMNMTWWNGVTLQG